MLIPARNSKHTRRLFVVIAISVAASMKVEAAPLPASTSPDRAQALIRETAAQLQIAYRLHPEEGGLRQQQLNAVVNAWRAAPRSDANNERLIAWLRSAIRASMPGSRDALPANPTFAGAAASTIVKSRGTPKPVSPEPTLAVPAVGRKKPAIATPASTAIAPAANQAADDPFRDDPVEE